MAEDNVVRPVFGQKKPEPPKEAPRAQSFADEMSEDYKHMGPLTGEALVQAQKDLLYMLQNSDYIQQMRDKLERAGDMIFSLRDYSPDKANIRLRREGLESYSLKELCELADRTTDTQWKMQPSYLGALTLEYHYRTQAAISIMPSDEGG